MAGCAGCVATITRRAWRCAWTRAPSRRRKRHLEEEALATALSRLGPDDRAVLACRFVTGLTEAETAEVLDIAVGTVTSRSSRALVRLHAELAPLAEESAP